MTDIKLVNVGGKIVAKDIDTGETVPIDLGETEADALSAGSTLSKRYEVDHSKNYPNSPNAPTASGPLTLKPHPAAKNPVLDGSESDDTTNPIGAADPFLAFEDGVYYLIYEIRADEYTIAYATSQDGVTWTYQQEILSDGEHSFPYTFKHGGEWYMTPRRRTGNTGDDEFKVYRATTFPTDWTLASTIQYSWTVGDAMVVHLPNLDGEPYDNSPISWDGTWYKFVEDNDTDAMRLFYADDLLADNWTEHAASPLYDSTDGQYNRPAGRPIVNSTHIDYPTRPSDGTTVVDMVRVTELSRSNYSDKPLSSNPVVSPSENGWFDTSMHHVDVLQADDSSLPVVAVDGFEGGEDWRVGIYTVGEAPTATRIGAEGIYTHGNSSNWVRMDFDSSGIDHRGWSDISDGSITVEQSGYYQVGAMVQWDVSSGSPFRTIIRVMAESDSSRSLSRANSHIAVDSINTTSSSGIWYVEEGEKLYVDIWQDSGGNLDYGNTSITNYLEIHRVDT